MIYIVGQIIDWLCPENCLSNLHKSVYGLWNEMLTHDIRSQNSITFHRSPKCNVLLVNSADSLHQFRCSLLTDQIFTLNICSFWWLTKYLFSPLAWRSSRGSPVRGKSSYLDGRSLNHARFMGTPGPTVHGRKKLLKVVMHPTPNPLPIHSLQSLSLCLSQILLISDEWWLAWLVTMFTWPIF